MIDRDHGPTDRLRVAIVDDDTIVREGLPLRLTAVEVALAVPDVTEFLRRRPTAGRLDAILLDLNLGRAGPGTRIQGRRAVSSVVAAGDRALIYISDTRPWALAGCLAAGASGLVHKTEPMNVLTDAVTTVARGGYVVTRAVTGLAEVLEHRGHLPTLTPRQLEVLRARARGESYALIAKRLYLSERTVEDHMASVVQKFAGYLADHSPADLERDLGVAPDDLLA